MSGQLLTELHSVLGNSGLIVEPAAMATYITDWRGRYTGDALAVARPTNIEQLSAVVKLCAAAKMAMVPQGGNTGLCGGATPLADASAIVVSTMRMNQVRALDIHNQTITVEAGCLLHTVQQTALANALYFPLSLAAEGSCSIGGNLSTNAGGVHVLRYGNMRNLVLGLEVVLADGRVINGLRGLRKDNTGYDLKQLFVGAEGTLGFISAAVLKLYPPPRCYQSALLQINSLADALLVQERFQAYAGERLMALELIGAPAFDLVLRHISGSRNPFKQPAPWLLLVELADTRLDAELGTQMEQVLAPAIESGLVVDAVLAQSLQERASLWQLRESISEAQKNEGFSIKHDISLPLSAIPKFIDDAQRQLNEAFDDIRYVIFGHLGDGNLHYNLSCENDVDNARLLEKAASINRIVYDLVASFDGSISAEHGIGQLKRNDITRYKDKLELDLMRQIKQVFDPHGLMNPGKVI